MSENVSVTVGDSNIADTNITGDGGDGLIVSFFSAATGVGGSVSNLRDLSDIDTTAIPQGSTAGDKFVLTYDAGNNKFTFVNPDAVLDAAVGVGATFPSPVGISSGVINYLDDELDNKIDLDGGQF